MATATLIPIPSDSRDIEIDGGQEFQKLPEQEQEPQFNVVPIQVILLGTLPSALPAKFLFAGLRHPVLRLREAIPLRSERSDGGISVIWDAVDEFGFGETFGAAVDDFSHTISELYGRLHSGSETFSRELNTVRETLDRYIESRRR